MVNQPFKTAELNEGYIIDETYADLAYASMSDMGVFNLPHTELVLNEVLRVSNQKVCLQINTDEQDIIPLLMIQGGYKWEPVWTRKLR